MHWPRSPGAPAGTFAHALEGTDDLGRDVFSGFFSGANLAFGRIVAVGIELWIGVTLGLLPDFFGGKTRRLRDASRRYHALHPDDLPHLAVLAFLGPNIYNVMAVIGLTAWPGLTRLVRGECLSIRERDICKPRASQGSNAPPPLVHLLPNVVAPILVSATLGVAGAILTESALSFLGLGVQPPTPSWGIS